MDTMNITFYDGTGQELNTINGTFNNQTIVSNDNIISFSWSSDFSVNSSSINYGPITGLLVLSVKLVVIILVMLRISIIQKLVLASTK